MHLLHAGRRGPIGAKSKVHPRVQSGAKGDKVGDRTTCGITGAGTNGPRLSANGVLGHVQGCVRGSQGKLGRDINTCRSPQGPESLC